MREPARDLRVAGNAKVDGVELIHAFGRRPKTHERMAGNEFGLSVADQRERAARTGEPSTLMFGKLTDLLDQDRECSVSCPKTFEDRHRRSLERINDF